MNAVLWILGPPAAMCLWGYVLALATDRTDRKGNHNG